MIIRLSIGTICRRKKIILFQANTYLKPFQVTSFNSFSNQHREEYTTKYIQYIEKEK